MSNLRHAAQQALVALEGNPISHAGLVNSKRAIVALRDALENGFNPDWDAMAVMVEEQMCMAKRIAELEAQTEQKPVAWLTKTGSVWKTKADETDTPLYTAPPQRKPLTGEEIAAIVREAAKGSAIKRDGSTSERIARAIEAAHGIKGEA